MNRFQFVEDHKDAYGVKRLCEVIEIARSSFYAWLAAAPGRAARAADDARLAARSFSEWGPRTRLRRCQPTPGFIVRHALGVPASVDLAGGCGTDPRPSHEFARQAQGADRGENRQH